jgi:hypothetical protein
MTTSNTSKTSFENMVKILSEISVAKIVVLPRFRDYLEGYTLGMDLAWAYSRGYFELSDKVVGAIQLSFLGLLSHCGLRDTGYSSLDEILEKTEIQEPFEDVWS